MFVDNAWGVCCRRETPARAEEHTGSPEIRQTQRPNEEADLKNREKGQ
jgi:hypothetical protein